MRPLNIRLTERGREYLRRRGLLREGPVVPSSATRWTTIQITERGNRYLAERGLV